MQFSHVGLSCRDVAAAERWYSRYFGFRRVRVLRPGPDQEIVFLRAGAVLLELFAADAERAGPAPAGDGPHSAGLRHLAFQVDDLPATLAALGADAHVTLGPLDLGAFIPGWRVVWISDPDGNIVEIGEGYLDEDPAGETL